MTVAELEGEAVVLDIDSGKYYGLNEVAVLVFDILGQPATKDEVILQLQESYEVDIEQLRNDVDELLDRLHTLNLIVVREEAHF